MSTKLSWSSSIQESGDFISLLTHDNLLWHGYTSQAISKSENPRATARDRTRVLAWQAQKLYFRHRYSIVLEQPIYQSDQNRLIFQYIWVFIVLHLGRVITLFFI